MKEIHGDASYVRNFDTAPPVGSDQGGAEEALVRSLATDVIAPEAVRRIWELLETPQTVETICRVLTHEFDLPPATSTEGVRLVLLRLYRDDLIQLSPDT